MSVDLFTRRAVLVAGGAVAATWVSGLLVPARAQEVAPTPSMPTPGHEEFKGYQPAR